MPTPMPEYISDALPKGKVAVPFPIPEYGPDQLLNEKAAAQYLSVSAQFLRSSRLRKPAWAGPPYVVVSKKAIRYRVGTLNDFIAARIVDPAERMATRGAA